MSQMKFEYSEPGEQNFATAAVVSAQPGRRIPVREIEAKLLRFLLSAGYPATNVNITLAEVPSE